MGVKSGVTQMLNFLTFMKQGKRLVGENPSAIRQRYSSFGQLYDRNMNCD